MGSLTDILYMIKRNPDLVIVSDDGHTTYSHGQIAYDCGIPVVVNHAESEKQGLMKMVELKKTFSISDLL